MSAGLSGFASGAEPGDFVSIRDQIVAAYQAAIDALSRGDLETALQLDTDDWVSMVVGQPARTKQDVGMLTATSPRRDGEQCGVPITSAMALRREFNSMT